MEMGEWRAYSVSSPAFSVFHFCTCSLKNVVKALRLANPRRFRVCVSSRLKRQMLSPPGAVSSRQHFSQ